ncbi:MAG: hypothetical protein ACR2KN_01655 [Geodermatophilaceae bacterium]
MNTDQLRADLRRRAEQAPAPPPDLAAQVLRRRRRARRQRAGLLAVAIAVVLVVTAIPLALTVLRAPAVAGRIYTLPTRGSLADDSALLAELVRAPWSSKLSYVGSDGSAYVAGTDLAAGIPASDRMVVFAGDVPGGRWALLAIPTVRGYAVAWFTGPPEARAAQLSMSGGVQLVGEGDPVSHVDLANPVGTVVVVAAPGDTISVAQQVDLSATLMFFTTATVLQPADGVGVTRLEASLRYGVPTRIGIERAGQPLLEQRPTVGGPLPAFTPGGMGPNDSPYAGAVIDRTGATVTVPRPVVEAVLGATLGPLGLTAQDLAATGPAIRELFVGTADGPLTENQRRPAQQPTVRIWSVEVTSGSFILVGGWSTTTADGAVQFQPTLLDVRAPKDDPASGVVAARVSLPAAAGAPAADVLVVSSAADAVRAEVLDAQEARLRDVELRGGAAVVPTPAGASTVTVSAPSGVRSGPVQDETTDTGAVVDAGRAPTIVTAIPPRR